MARLDVLNALADGSELDVLEVQAATGLGRSTVQEQLSRATAHKLVTRRSIGRRLVYRIVARGLDRRDHLSAKAQLPPQGARFAQRSLREMVGPPADKLQVFRIEGDGTMAEIPRGWTTEHLARCGNDFHTFALRQIAPDFGGGDYLIRGIDGVTGQVVIESRVKIAGWRR